MKASFRSIKVFDEREFGGTIFVTASVSRGR
jgi:hypothetical protein